MATKLTAKQERFCNEIASGKNQSDAYREAFDIKKMTNKTLNERASVLANKDKIRTRVAELRKPVVEKTQETLEGHLAELKRIRELAIDAKQYAPAISAETSRGKALGYYVEKSQVTVDNIKPFVIVRYAGD